MTHFLIILMKKSRLALASLTLLFACVPQNIPGDDDGPVTNNGGTAEVVATGIKLSANYITLEKGASEALTVTYTPSNTTNKDIIWVSSNSGIATVMDGIVVGVATGSTEILAKCGDVTDKCKVTVVLSATGIRLDKTSLELVKGDSETIIATVEPVGSTDIVTWKTSEEAVATVADGVVSAVYTGKAVITVQAGHHKAECVVTVSPSLTIPEAVDLGLSVKWASLNLGASRPEEDGDYYAWGETMPKINCCWSTYTFGDSDGPFSKYNTQDSHGDVDNMTVLDPEDDAAHVVLGSKWRMPTWAELDELITQCLWTWTSINGVNGYNVTGNNGNSIFLPSAAGRDHVELYYTGFSSFYWSSSLDPDHPDCAFGVYFFKDNTVSQFEDRRCYGHTIRPITE